MKIQDIKILVTDCDGVLTNGSLNIDHLGEKMFKTFHVRDISAIRQLIYSGWEVYIVSADNSSYARHFADKVGAEFLYMRDKGDLPVAIGHKPYVAVGDSDWDVPMLKYATYAFCPSDAGKVVTQLPNIKIVDRKGGKGVISDIAFDYLLNEE